MSSFTTLRRASSPLALALALAACGGVTSVPAEPAPPGAATGEAPAATAPEATAAPPRPRPIAEPTTTPYTGLVGTTDVSILYPLPAAGGLAGLVAPSDVGNHGLLLPEAFLEAGLADSGGRLDNREPSSYRELRLVGLRLDPCATREGAPCASEVRAVFQALRVDATGAVGAIDGGVHAMYGVTSDELDAMLRQILSRKAENGNLAVEELGPHPILSAQGVGGPFARGLRDIVLYHLGEDRLRRVTMFDHGGDPETHTWTFTAVDRVAGVPVVTSLPHLGGAKAETVSGGEPEVAPGDDGRLSMTDVFMDASHPVPDSVLPVFFQPWEPGLPASSKDTSLHAKALRVQDPTKHDAATTTCVNCHLAEGAARLGKERFGLATTPTFAAPRPLGRTDVRGSVTNFHAFGWLGRSPAVMQRTANESVLVAEAMAQRLAPTK